MNRFAADRPDDRQVSAVGSSTARTWSLASLDAVVTPFSYPQSVKVRDVIRTLEQDGWCLDRQVDSHRQFRHPGRPGTVTVAGKPSGEVPKGTLRSICRQAGRPGRQNGD